MSFPPQFLDELRARLPASEVIGRSVRLTRRGREHSGLCPFHKEKTPSFTVNDEKAFFHCFGCGAHGDVIGFLMQHEGVGFVEAVEKLAGEAGLAVPARSPEARFRAAHQAGLYEVLETAAGWFSRVLARDEGAAARRYFEKRGFDAGVIERFRLGYAPDRRGALKAFLSGEGVPEALAVEAGLLRRRDDGETFDFFRGRVMFPITDARGRVIGFGGRTLGDARPKYINSPESDVFHKGRSLYNLGAARRPAREAGAVTVAEGYTDVIALARAGHDNAVAPLGTALTDAQLTALWRLAAEPLLCLDGDDAGRRAAARAAERALPLLAPGRSLQFSFLPEGEDPDSLLSRTGPEGLAEALTRATSLADILWQQTVTGRRSDTPERRAGVRKALDSLVARIKDPEVRGQYRTEFRRRCEAMFSSPLRGARRRLRRPGPAASRFDRPPAAAADLARRERIMLISVLNHPSLIEALAEELAALSYTSPTLDQVRRALVDIAADGSSPGRAELTAELDRRGLGGTVGRLLATDSWGGSHVVEGFARADAPDSDAEDGFRHLAARHRRAAVETELRAAELALAETMNEEALDHLIALRHQLDDIDKVNEAAPGEGGQGGLASRASRTN